MLRGPSLRLLLTVGTALVVLGVVAWLLAGSTPPARGWIGAPPPEPAPESFGGSVVSVRPLRLWSVAIAGTGLVTVTAGLAYRAGARRAARGHVDRR